MRKQAHSQLSTVNTMNSGLCRGRYSTHVQTGTQPAQYVNTMTCGLCRGRYSTHAQTGTRPAQYGQPGPSFSCKYNLLYRTRAFISTVFLFNFFLWDRRGLPHFKRCCLSTNFVVFEMFLAKVTKDVKWSVFCQYLNSLVGQYWESRRHNTSLPVDCPIGLTFLPGFLFLTIHC